MTGLTAPARHLIAESEVIEEFGVPEFFANGAVVVKEDEVVSLVFYVTRQDKRHEVLRIHMPRSAYCKSRHLPH